jgi:hypothetical protein
MGKMPISTFVPASWLSRPGDKFALAPGLIFSEGPITSSNPATGQGDFTLAVLGNPASSATFGTGYGAGAHSRGR